MTELYIDKQRTVLPETFSITAIEENVVFTKNGEYTYDITLSLLNPINARIYKHSNRVNRKTPIPKNRPAFLVVDNRVMLNGTEIILEISESEVKIQLVSGNSELNFLIGGDKRIRDLDLGIAEIPVNNNDGSFQRWVDKRWNKVYPEVEWHLLPYYTNEYPLADNLPYYRPFGNGVFLFNRSDTGEFYSDYQPPQIGPIPQPYFCAIIDKIIRSLGYYLSYNELADHPVFRYYYIVHGIKTIYFSKMLPDWTVNDFLSKIELQFGCVFIVSNKNVELRFKHNASDYNKRISVDVLDEFQVTIEGESNEAESALSSGNFGYSLDSDDYYKFMCLSDYSRESIPVTHDLGENSSFPAKNPGGLIYPDRLKCRYYGRDVVSAFMIYNTGIKEILRKIDAFRPVYNTNSGELDIEFDIIPAAMVYTYISPFRNDDYEFWVQVPIAGNYDSILSPEASNTPDDFTLQELIENNISQTEEVVSYTKMRLAIFDGQKYADTKYRREGVTDKKALFPLSYVESLCEYFEEYTETRFFNERNVNPFRLEYMQNEIYNKQRKVDTSKPYKYKIKNRYDIDIRATFIINNKEFVCYKIEREITASGFNKFVTGYFYAKY